MANPESVDISTFYDNKDVKNLEVSPRDLLRFAKHILFFLFILVIFVFSASYLMSEFEPDNKNLFSIVESILDTTKTSVPAIVTLVLGFYFGKRQQ